MEYSEDSEDNINLAKFYKELGNVAFRKKDYQRAIENFRKAVHLNPNEIIYRNNIAAVHFSQGALKECVSVCEEAYRVGLQNHAENRNMARCLYRMSCCLLKLKNSTTADHFAFLAEHNHFDASMRSLYLKFKEGFEANQKADQCLKEDKFPEAVRWYSRAIELKADNVEALSNRACCYAKLLEFALSVSDCERVLALQPDNVRMLVRKGSSLLALGRYEEAEGDFVRAWSLDRTCQEALAGVKRSSSQKNLSREDSARLILKDPGVRGILDDPHVKALLYRDQHTYVFRKEEGRQHYHDIDKLIECGLVRLQGIT